MFKFKYDKNLYNYTYCADYFIKADKIIKKSKNQKIVIMQWFQRTDQIKLCGIDYILGYLKTLKKKLEVWYVPDGSIINSLEPILKIKGKYQDLCHLEGLFDGILSRCSSIATNAWKLKDAANGKLVLNMGDRADIFNCLAFDGYASVVGGIEKLVTKASYQFIDKKPILAGTMPHALIAAYDGDIIKAADAYHKTFPNNNLICLVDYNNDCINDSLKLANHFKEKLFAVRVDTSDSLIDKSFEKSKIKYNGVNPILIKNLRKELDKNGYNYVKIIASSGFDVEKISYFEKENAPVDIYGVGEAIFKKKTSFTGDVVFVNGVNQAKVGRQEKNSKKLVKITYN